MALSIMSPVLSASWECGLCNVQRLFRQQTVWRTYRNHFATYNQSKPTRKWHPVKGDVSDSHAQSTTPFTVMSYNILSQTHLQTHKSLYVDHDPAALDWSHRIGRISNEITQIAPDILCLQEMESQYLPELSGKLCALNFNEALYKKRSGNQIDGCAIYFNPNKFQLIESHAVDYFQPNVRILNRCNVAIVARFALQSNQNVHFVVATTHLLFNPKRTDVRLAQVQVLLAELDRIAHNGHDAIPIILCGDFNFEPHSHPFRLITGQSVRIQDMLMQRKVVHSGENVKTAHQLLPNELGISDNCQHYDVIVSKQRQRTALHSSMRKTKITDEQIRQSGLPFNTGIIKHKLNLETTMTPTNMRQCASSCHHKWITVDYIFYSHHRNTDQPMMANLELLANYELPTVDECLAEGSVPNVNNGSDHYPLAARFTIGNGTEPTVQ